MIRSISDARWFHRPNDFLDLDRITRDDVSSVRTLLASSCGLELSTSRLERATSHLQRQARLAGISVSEYVSRLRPDITSAPMADLIAVVTNQESSFFRGQRQLDVLMNEGIRPLVRSGEVGPRLRIWSGACSTGEEAITLAILVQELASPGVRPGFDFPAVELVASDLSMHAVEAARNGRFSPISARHLGTARVARFFDDDQGALKVRPTALPPIEYRTHNLTRPNEFGMFDVVVIRNVLFYLHIGAQAAVIANALRSVKPGGLAVFGANDGVSLPTGFSSLGAHCWRREISGGPSQ